MDKDYKKLLTLSRKTQLLSGISSLLDWDAETYMPPKAAPIRSEQQERLAGLIHKEKTGKKFAKALDKLIHIKSGHIQNDHLSDELKASLHCFRHDFLQATALPTKFVEETAKLTAESVHVWRKAKETDDFNLFAPYLEKIVKKSRKKAEYLGYKKHPYDALLDLYEPGITTEDLKKLFAEIQANLKPLLANITKHSPLDPSPLNIPLSTSDQLTLGNTLLTKMAFDLEKGRLDLSSHPFSSSAHPSDCRLTTRINKTDVASNIFVVLHEAGHGLYEMGLPEEHYGSPLCEAISMGFHESQSRWWETRIGQSRAFWQFFLPYLQEKASGQLNQETPDSFYRLINRVAPSFIRVDADEVTYPLHVILRFELEAALIEGSLAVKDLPAAWNAKMQDLLGITPPTNREGCLQDIHWAMGGFGYFPSYTLGNLYAASMFTTFAKEHPTWQGKVASGELSFITAWLKEHVHRHGRRYKSQELIQKITGERFRASDYISYLSEKYNELFPPS